MSANNKDQPVAAKNLYKVATGDLSDEEVTLIGQVVGQLVQKYAMLPPTENNLARLDDEATDRLHRLGYLVHLDIEPVLQGKPPVLDIIGRVGDMGFQAPHDHEKSGFMIKKGRARGEAWLGEKEPVNSTPARKRNKLILPKDNA